MKIKVHRFTDEGLKKWRNLYGEIFLSIDSKVENRRSPGKAIIKGFNENLKKKFFYLKDDTTIIEEVKNSKELNIKNFKNSFEMANEINNALINIEYSEISEDCNLWDWLSMILFEQIFVPEKIGGYMEYRYVLNLDLRFRFRHLIRGPWWTVNQYKNHAKIFTYTKPYEQNDFLEQFIKIQDLREMKTIPEMCMKLYYDEESERSVPGISKGKIGGFPRLRDKIAQFNKIKNLWDMSADEIIKLLPKEFDKYKKK
jgi:hypothetical protein